MSLTLHDLRKPNAPAKQIVAQFGLEAVRGELEEMCYSDMANWAMESSEALEMTDIAAEAAWIVQNGGYSQPDKERARRILGLRL
jgi:hypothetical protein